MSSLQHKMYDLEVKPPAMAWDKIAAALDESEMSSKFPTALQQMEIAPPPAAWNRISQLLEAEQAPEQETPVIPMRRRTAGFVRYAAAAAVIAAVAFGVVRLTMGADTTATASTEPEDSSTIVAPAKPTLPANENAVAITPQEQPPATPSNLNNLPVKQTQPERSTRNAGAIAARDNSTARSAGASSYSKAIYTYNDHVPAIAERYITLLTPNGSFIRMSKKWSNLLCCVSGEEQDAGCKDQIKKWQEKIAASPVTPAPGNFMDLLDLVNSLNEDTQL